jgi:hypothetical protein
MTEGMILALELMVFLLLSGLKYKIQNTKYKIQNTIAKCKMVEGEGFEPSKAEPSDLQSDPFGHSGTPPQQDK